LHIRLRLPQGAMRGWQVRLAQALAAQGHAVAVELVAGIDTAMPGLELLRYVESQLYSRTRFSGADPCAIQPREAFAAFADEGAAADVVLDCTGLPLEEPGETPVLQPSYGGGLSESLLVEALADNRPPLIGWRRAGDGALLAGGEVAILSPHVMTQGLSDSFMRMISLAEKALRLIHAPVQAMPLGLLAPQGPGPGVLPAFAIAAAAARIQGRIAALLSERTQWMVGWRASSFGDSLIGSGSLKAEPIRWIDSGPSRYFADPFPFEHEGRRFVFVEELPYVTGRGLISVIELDAALAPVSIRPVLEEPVHMSYPSVFRYGDHIWMIPETVDRRRLELYRADPFPDRWVLHQVLIDDIHAADPTLFAHDGLLWISAATADHGATDRDSMSLFYAERLEGPWTAHPLNPVVVDVRGARPAGWIVRGRDGLRRPAQDCSAGYGLGLSVRRIDALSRETYAETELSRIAPPPLWKAGAFHTVNWQAGIEAVDAIR